MKCQICGCHTTWDESFGRESFIVCPKCENAIRCCFDGNYLQSFNLIMVLGELREEYEKEKESKNA